VVNKAGSAINPPSSAVQVVYGSIGSIPVTISGRYSGAGINTPTGLVSYSILNSGSTVVASGTASISSGAASVPVANTLAAGLYTVPLSYGGDSDYNGATVTTSFTVAGVAPTLSFGPIAAQTYGNPPFAVSATSPSSGVVTYTVVSGPATIAGNIVTLTGGGTVILLANQAASGNYAAATATTSFIVAAAPVGFTLASSSGSGVETVLPGGAAAFRLTLAPVSGSTYPDALTLSATGLPAGATAAFSPATIPAGSGATAVTMTIQTTPPTARSAKPFLGGQMGSMALAFLLLPMAGIKPVRKGLRKLPGLAVAALALGAMVCLSGCSSNGFFNQAPKSYTVVVTATDAVTGAHSSTNVTLTVQ
jgi:hypothetical protein